MPPTTGFVHLVAAFEGWLGLWEGEGRGLWDADPPFRYREALTIEAIPGRPLLRLTQRTTVDNSTDLSHSEVGYLRLLPELEVELVVAIPAGYVEVHTGRLEDGVLELRPQTLATTPTARPVRLVRRRMELVDGALHNTVGIAVNEEEIAPHVESWLRRRF
ncbi:MAG: heme-binding beta-barrel domain-containing protein [Candidatus Dormiibacterota bacterium]